jgi:hypothetical protein
MNYLYIALPLLTLAAAGGFVLRGGKDVKLGYFLLSMVIFALFAFFIGTMIGFLIP